MCDQAWNCWLMQTSMMKEELHTFHQTGAEGAAASSAAAKGAAGWNTCGAQMAFHLRRGHCASVHLQVGYNASLPQEGVRW